MTTECTGQLLGWHLQDFCIPQSETEINGLIFSDSTFKLGSEFNGIQGVPCKTEVGGWGGGLFSL